MAQPLRGKYIEPFLGSGAVYFALRPTQAVLSDANFELINTYQAIKDDPKMIERLLREHQRQHSKDYYYKMRSYKPRCEYRMAARFIYLNRTCWNGLYRVNLSGKFNVPIGTKSAVTMETDNWSTMAELLKPAKLICGDFESSIEMAKKDDVVFADPPYTVKHNLNGFINSLSVNNIYFQRHFSERDNRGSQMVKRDKTSLQFLVPYQQFAEADNHPPTRKHGGIAAGRGGSTPHVPQPTAPSAG